MLPAARLGDLSSCPADSHGCPGCPHPATGPSISGSEDVNINSRPAMRVGDKGIHAACCGPNTWEAKTGSQTVFINGKPAHRLSDVDKNCGGMGRTVTGSGNVFIGGPPTVDAQQEKKKDEKKDEEQEQDSQDGSDSGEDGGEGGSGEGESSEGEEGDGGEADSGEDEGSEGEEGDGGEADSGEDEGSEGEEGDSGEGNSGEGEGGEEGDENQEESDQDGKQDDENKGEGDEDANKELVADTSAGQRDRALDVVKASPPGSVGAAIRPLLSGATGVVGNTAAGDVGDFYESQRELLNSPATDANIAEFARRETDFFNSQPGLAGAIGSSMSADTRAWLIRQSRDYLSGGI